MSEPLALFRQARYPFLERFCFHNCPCSRWTLPAPLVSDEVELSMPSPHERAPDGQPASTRLHSAVCSGATPSRLAHRGACKVRRLIINLYIPASHSTADNPYSVQLRHNLEFALRIPLSERPRKFCRACGTETPWNTHDRCMVCQRKRSKEYSGRTPRFPKAVKDRLRSEHQVRCPNCLTLWKDVKLHSRHPQHALALRSPPLASARRRWLV
jgi:hypothetical protein